MRSGDGTAIVGVGYTEFSTDSGRSVLSLACEAARAAIADAGLEPSSANGVATYAVGDSVPAQAVAHSAGIGESDYLLDVYMGGQAPAYLLLQVQAALVAGLADTVVIFRALNGRSGLRVGRHRPSGPPAPAVEARMALGLEAYPQYIAMWAQRFLHDTGATEEDLAAVVLAQREYAQLNDRAIERRPLTREQYFASPYISTPFRAVDCTREVDGACAIVVTTAERARDLRKPPIRLLGGAYAAGGSVGLDMGDVVSWQDYSRNAMSHIGRRLWNDVGIAPRDVDVAELYDCFSSSVLFALEGLGITERGGSGEFVRSGATALTGELPVNTHGGLLSEGYLHGMNSLAEAVLQLRGEAGARTVVGAETALVTSGALMDGSAVVLGKGS